MSNLKGGDKVIINGIEFKYCADYKRLYTENDSVSPSIACPECYGTEFTISYGDYECIANCKCGNLITIYDG